jgi:methylmalonyl-CoA carboxyltransferase 12S subunit
MVEDKKTARKKAAGSEAAQALLARIDELEARIARLEAARDAAVTNLVAAAAVPRPAPVPTAAAAAPPAPAVAHEEITEDVLLVIAATVAAFLGERAHVRQVRLVASEAWAQQGRVSVMASHRWAVHR